ncbi:hypothetical protein LJC68_10660 [Bacteroidales bacterium OttesenSCG-928-B11]|nr:hypothetical protein [Bacteroidales bacterium OttesenSCG-928-B11]
MKNLQDEKNHIENLLNTRFNFFMMILLAIIASLFTIKNINQLIVILILGSIIETCLFLVIARAQVKLEFYLKEIRKDIDEAEYNANVYANSKKNFLINKSRFKIVGYYLPLVIVLILIISSFFPKFIYDNVIISKENSEQRQEYIIKKTDDSLIFTKKIHIEKDSTNSDIKNLEKQ